MSVDPPSYRAVGMFAQVEIDAVKDVR